MHRVYFLAAGVAGLIALGSLTWAHSGEVHAPAEGGHGAGQHAPAEHPHPNNSDHPHPAAGDGHGDVREQMRELHRGHEHEHDFDVLEEMSPEQMNRVMDVMREVGLAMRPMDPAQGRELFVEKGCIVCHSVNGIGGEIGPSLNARDMPSPMSAFEFAARMWRGAAAMVAMQEQLFGEQIQLTGKELADIIAFAHDEAEQEKLTAEQIPERFQEMIEE